MTNSSIAATSATDLRPLVSPVISEPEAARICGLSLVHFRRMRRAGTGPKAVRLSERRIGYRLSSLETWLSDRTA